ncbi:MAG: SseB family protein [Fibrobacterota bacterium]|nr:SseB family protein [Fibrobacterota bacterium]
MNELESALTKAFENPDCRMDFYRVLAISAIYVLAARDGQIKIDPATGEVTGLELVRLKKRTGGECVPFFSSPEYMEKLPPSFGQFGKVKLMARQFFRIIQGTPCVLNPSSDLSKEFDPGEMELALAGPPSEDAGIPPSKETATIRFLDPSGIPAGMLALLADHSRRDSGIRGAWLALKQGEGEPEASCTLLLDASGERDSRMAEFGKHLSSLPDRGPYLDVSFDSGDAASGTLKRYGVRLK